MVTLYCWKFFFYGIKNYFFYEKKYLVWKKFRGTGAKFGSLKVPFNGKPFPTDENDLGSTARFFDVGSCNLFCVEILFQI